MADDKKHRTQMNAEDMASLYSWANLEGAKYREYSASRNGESQPGATVEAAAQGTEKAQESVVGNGNGAMHGVNGNGADTSRAAIEVSELEDDAPLEQPAWLRRSSIRAAAETAPAEVLQQSRERVASRWYALKGVFEQNSGSGNADDASEREVRVPYLGILSLAGGVGKTSIVATLGRALSEYGEKVLLVDATSYGLLPFYFGARELRPGNVRTFSPPGGSTDAPIHMVSVEDVGSSIDKPSEGNDSLGADLRRFGRGSNRVLVDLATGSGGMVRRFLQLNPNVLVPIAPDMNSIVSLGMLKTFLRNHNGADSQSLKPYFLLNHFDSSLPLHLDVREVLREQLGDRLLPFVIRRSPAVSEALAEGMTVVDYAPNSPVAEDFMALANWIRGVSAPASTGFRGVRWSER
jgi:cellulose synthase operon protein YhjQ